MNQHSGTSSSRSSVTCTANQAGQAATIATVQAVTGQHIDHFVEVNLAGFYYLAEAFGGIEVCIKPSGGDANLHDYNSGFSAYLDGYNKARGGRSTCISRRLRRWLSSGPATTLPNVDLGRTQAAAGRTRLCDLRSSSTKARCSASVKLTSLLNTAKQYLITDSTFNLLDFATNMRALTGKNLPELLTRRPSSAYRATVNKQDVNLIDVSTIQAAIKERFTAPAPAASGAKSSAKATLVPPASTVIVDVYNGGMTPGLATGISQALVAKGYKAGAVTNAAAQSQAATAGTQVFYGAGTSANAAKIAGYFGATASALTSLPAGHVEVLLGTGATVVPATLSPSSPSTGASASSSATASAAGNNGAAGGALTVDAKAKYGIPCVY